MSYTLTAYSFKGTVQHKVGVWLLPTGKFSLGFLHSVTLTSVLSDYTITNNKIIQVAERFETHGYGLPSAKNEVGVLSWQKKDGAFFLKMQRNIEPLIVRISSEYKTALYINNQKITFPNYDGESLLFKAKCST